MPDNNKRKLYIVAGPTAVGKTKFSIDLAKKINGEIISLDSIQVYKGLDIGSSKIRKSETEGVPHFMIDIIEPTENINIKDFKDLAYKYIDEIYNRKHIPILVGGTGFYIDAILYNTDFSEENDDKKEGLRESIYNDIEEKGIDYIYEKLREVDPESCKNIHKNNIKRVVRAYEYFLLTGEKISSHNAAEKKKESPFDFTFYVLEKDRDKLYNDIDLRVDKMFADGLIEEVASLIKKGVMKTHQSMQAIGYKELYDYVAAGAVDSENIDSAKLEKIKNDIKTHTRQYAKRQLTWFRHEENIEYIKV